MNTADKTAPSNWQHLCPVIKPNDAPMNTLLHDPKRLSETQLNQKALQDAIQS